MMSRGINPITGKKLYKRFDEPGYEEEVAARKAAHPQKEMGKVTKIGKISYFSYFWACKCFLLRV